MQNSDEILSLLQSAGVRMTVARKAIIRLFAASASPLTASGVLMTLKRSHIEMNKTTVYRELRFLEERGVIRAMQFDERNRRYELSPKEHRHHLICTSCKKIEDIVLDHDLDHVEETVTKEKRFKVQRHALEFYGTCGSCQG